MSPYRPDPKPQPAPCKGVVFPDGFPDKAGDRAFVTYRPFFLFPLRTVTLYYKGYGSGYWHHSDGREVEGRVCWAAQGEYIRLRNLRELGLDKLGHGVVKF